MTEIKSHDNDEAEPIPDHDSLVADWQQHAKESDDINFQFLRSLKRRSYGFQADELASELHEKVFQIVDCTRCANCCRTANVTLDQDDIDRTSKHLGLGTQEFINKYLEPSEQDGMLAMRQKPCPLLGDDNLCTVYDVRPKGCREYPHTDKDGFSSRTFAHAQNALMCPAVFWIVEKMRHRAMGRANGRCQTCDTTSERPLRVRTPESNNHGDCDPSHVSVLNSSGRKAPAVPAMAGVLFCRH